MKQMIHKLIAVVMALILTVVMAVTISYAWVILSDAPTADGIQVTIGGGKTILVAADHSQAVNGVVYHYPGVFSDTLNFRQYSQYDYLGEVAALAPVSTADGYYWLVPEYYDLFDKEIATGEASVGEMKPYDEFTVDTDLAYANLTAQDAETAEKGHYIYLDFWVVSPRSDYVLRVSRGDENGGSFALELMSPAAVDGNGDGTPEVYRLVETTGSAAASLRIGFLVNEADADSDAMACYLRSGYAASDVTTLRGVYQESKDGMSYEAFDRFTIYEPNADKHPFGIDVTYSMTLPLAVMGNTVMPVSIADRLTVQLTNRWRMVTDMDGIALEQMFQTAIAGKTYGSLDEMKTAFYHGYLQGQFAPYINTGAFVKRTADLYAMAQSSNGNLASLDTAGATDDVYITALQQNVPQRIRMFIWLEGQDVDCNNQTGAHDFALSIELAGSDQQ